jgi:AraC-like DNA-binding protein
MLMARGVTHVGAGSGRMDWAVAFASRMRLSIVERRGLVLDTHFVPPAQQHANHNPCLYILLRGSFRVGGGALQFHGPAAFVVSEEHLEGGDGRRSITYRTDPNHFEMIEVHLDANDTSLRAGALPALVTLDARAWDAAMRVGRPSTHDDDSMTAAISVLLEALAALSLVSAEAVAGARQPPAAPLRLLWKALRPMAERLDLLPTVQQISGVIGATPREVDGYVRRFLSASGLVGTGWRPASRHLRLKMAVIMLSAKDATVAEVARVTGYGSTDALARAFRDAELPAPSAVREALRAAVVDDVVVTLRDRTSS